MRVDFERIQGSGFADNIIGSDQDDVIYGNNGMDIISGGLGDDYLSALGYPPLDDVTYERGPAVLRGGPGDDGVRGDPTDTLYGGDGNDQIWGGKIAYGGDGNDVFDGLGTTVLGGAGHDVFVDFYDSNTVRAGSGNDKLSTDYLHWHHDDRDFFYLESGNDEAFYSLRRDSTGLTVLHGGTGVDTLVLEITSNPKTPRALVDFRVQAEGGWLALVGGTRITEFETVHVDGPLNANEIIFGNHNDSYRALAGLYTEDGLILRGMGGNDILDTGGSRNTVYGGTGNDLIISDGREQRAYGGSGNDVIFGQWMQQGNDTISTMSGNSGADTFVFGLERPKNQHVIKDFERGSDKIAFYLLMTHDYEGPGAMETAPLRVQNVVNKAGFLAFDVIGLYADSARMGTRIHYNKVTGLLSKEDERDYDDGFWDVAQLTGAPDLSMSDFMLMA